MFCAISLQLPSRFFISMAHSNRLIPSFHLRGWKTESSDYEPSCSPNTKISQMLCGGAPPHNAVSGVRIPSLILSLFGTPPLPPRGSESTQQKYGQKFSRAFGAQSINIYNRRPSYPDINISTTLCASCLWFMSSIQPGTWAP